MADEAEREIVEQGDHAGPLEEGGKDDEDEDVGRRHIDRRAVDALGAEAHMLDDLRNIVAAMDEGRRQILAEEAVGQEQAGDDGERPAHQPAGALEDQRDHHRADDEVGRGEKAGAQQDVVVEHPIVDAGEEAEDAQPPQSKLARARRRLQIGEQPEAEQQQEGDMHGAHDLAWQIAVGGGEELEQREGDGDGERRRAPAAHAPAGGKALGGDFVDGSKGWWWLCGVGHCAPGSSCHALLISGSTPSGPSDHLPHRGGGDRRSLREAIPYLALLAKRKRETGLALSLPSMGRVRPKVGGGVN
jgi:hypothetical protein